MLQMYGISFFWSTEVSQNKQLKKINNKYQSIKKASLHHTSAYIHTRGSDAIASVASICSPEVTLTACSNLGFLNFSFQKLWGVQIFVLNL